MHRRRRACAPIPWSPRDGVESLVIVYADIEAFCVLAFDLKVVPAPARRISFHGRTTIAGCTIRERSGCTLTNGMWIVVFEIDAVFRPSA